MDDIQIAEKLIEQFSNIAETLHRTIKETNVSSEQLLEFNEFSIWLRPTTISELENIIQDLDNQTSSGADHIRNMIVKSCSKQTPPVSFETAIFPSKLKKSIIFPLHNGDCKCDLNGYRPISLIIVFSKVFERAMHNRV